MIKSFKQTLTRIGARTSQARLAQLRASLNYLMIGRWMEDRGYRFDPRVPHRTDVWDRMLEIASHDKVLYLEFGVYTGIATRYWSQGLANPDSVLHGFDSFIGLPDQAGPWEEGQFDLGGSIPKIDDARVRFFKGWFDETLPTYEAPPHDRLVLNMDADLYSSTACVFKHVGPLVRPGTLIYFDEMNHVEHEPKAFDEFVRESGRRFRPVAADRTLAFVAFECVE